MSRRAWIASFGVAFAFAATPAVAGEAPPLPTETSFFGFDFGLWPSSVGRVYFGDVDGQVSLQRHVAITFSVPVANGPVFLSPASTQTLFGNAGGGLLLAWIVTGSRAPLALSTGLSFTGSPSQPAHPLLFDFNGTQVASLAAAAGGLYHEDSYSPGWDFFRVPLGLELQSWNRLTLRSEFAFLIAFPNATPTHRSGVVLETSVEAEVRIWDQLRVGARAQFVAGMTPQSPPTSESDIVGVEPFLAYRPGRLLPFVRAGALFTQGTLGETGAPTGVAVPPPAASTFLVSGGMEF
jgi:hypothetical protein